MTAKPMDSNTAQLMVYSHFNVWPGHKDFDKVTELLTTITAAVRREAAQDIRSDLNSMGEAPLFSPGMSYQQGMDWAARLLEREG